MLSDANADIVATTVQAFLTGVYFATFLLCLRWLIFSDDGGALRKAIRWPFAIITVILFAFSVTDLSVSLKATLLSSQTDTTVSYYLIYSYIITMFLEMLALIIVDGVLIFRCWTVYNRSWRIALFPLLLLLFNISNLLVLTYGYAIFGNSGFYESNNTTMGSYFAATITINLYATSAITFRIWRNSLSRRFARFAIRVIAESGLLYTLSSIASLYMAISNSTHGLSTVTAINSRTAGIAFDLILIRVAQNRANPEPELPTFIGDSTVERAIPAAPYHNSETVAESTGEGL